MRIRKRKFTNRGEWKLLRTIVDGVQPLMSATLQRGFKRSKKTINLRTLEELIRDRRFTEIETVVPYSGIFSANELDRFYSGAILNSTDKSKEFFQRTISRLIPTVNASGFNVNTDNPRVQRWILNRTATMIQGVTNESRRAVSAAITQSLDFGLTPKDAAYRIRDSIGLTWQQQEAVNRFREKLNQGSVSYTPFQQESLVRSTRSSRILEGNYFQNLTPERIDELVEDYANRQLAYRADVIARNELQEAVNEGQRETWNQAAEQGLINPVQTMKQWIVTPDDRLCEICEDMDGVEVALNDMFTVPKTGESVDGPPSHVGCRCASTIIFAEERE